MKPSSAFLLLLATFESILGYSVDISEHRKQKRQLFREQVVPEVGGKIPEFAYRPDRISLNLLNQNGVTYNGYILEPSRSISRYETKVKNPEVLRLSFSNNRAHFIADNLDTSLDAYTAYVIRKPTKIRPPVIPIRYTRFPISPLSSLKLIYRYRQERNRPVVDPCENNVFPSGCSSENIFQEFAPYLKKIHELY